MKRTLRRKWIQLAVGLLTVPLMAASCIEIAGRSIIHGFFDAAIPTANAQLADCLPDDGADGAEP
jgi:hypothetical protein